MESSNQLVQVYLEFLNNLLATYRDYRSLTEDQELEIATHFREGEIEKGLAMLMSLTLKESEQVSFYVEAMDFLN